MRLPYIICEIGLNHGGDLHLARKMIWEAAEAGADAVKFQAVWADTLCTKDSPTYFQQVGETAQTQWEFFKRSDALTRQDYEELARYAALCGVDFGITCFQPEDIRWADQLVQWHKIASADITNGPLLEAAATTGKPVFLSTGAATEDEIRTAVMTHLRAARDLGQLQLMHCVLEYPTPPEHANLSAIGRRCDGLSRRGYSCHVPFNLDVLVTAWLLGAQYIEKHFTLDKTQAGNDHYHSMDPQDLRQFVARCRDLLPVLGDGHRGTVPDHERAAREHARRSWAARHHLDVGAVLSADDLIALRPGTGIPVSETLVGRVLTAPVQAGHLIPPEALAPIAENPHIFA